MVTNVRRREGNPTCAALGLEGTAEGGTPCWERTWEEKAEEGAAAVPTPRLSGIQVKMKEGLVIY